MTRSAAGFMVIIAAMLGTSVAMAAQRTYDKQLDAPPGGRLTLNADVGSVTVVGRDTSRVVIHADLQGSDSFLAHLRISAAQTPSGVTISEHAPDAGGHGWLGWLGWLIWPGGFGYGDTRVRFDVEVPRSYPVDVRTAGGGIHLRDLGASASGKTSGGSIVVQNVTGPVDMHTSGGGIDAEHLEGPADLGTSGGGIQVTDATGDLELRTSGGGIRIQNGSGRVDAHTSGGSITAQLQANRGINLTTSGGSITLLLPQNAQASVDAATSGGRVTSEFSLSAAQVAESSHLVGDLGGGGASIFLRTSGGGIHLAPAD